MARKGRRMLVIKVFATKKVPIREGESVEKGKKFHTDLELIDEIHIQNIGRVAGDVYRYEVKKPKGVKARIVHPRSDGYRPLLERALALLEFGPKNAYKRRKKDEL